MAPSAEIERFLRRAARRLLLRRLLAATLWGAAANALLFGAVRGANRALQTDLGLIDLGPAVVAVLSGRALLRLRRRRLVPEVDRELRLKDGLVSFVDFAGRRDVDPRLREAQAFETSVRVGACDVNRGVRIHRLLWAAQVPALAVLALSAVDPWTSLNLLRVQDGEPGGGRVSRVGPPAAGRDAHEPAGEPGPAPSGSPGERSAKAPEPPRPAGTGLAPETQTAERGQGGTPRDVREPVPGPAPDLGHAKSPGPLEEPATLYSETVGEGLTPVREYQPGPGRPPAAPEAGKWPGRISFHLAPQNLPGGGAGAADGGNAAAGRLEITVDFDRVPLAYRGLVRRYFERLQQTEGG